MKVVSFINEKGGTCKTTLAVNLAAYFALYKKKRVLLLDLDSQGHVGKSLGVNVREAPITIMEWMTNQKVHSSEAVLETRIENLNVIVANKRLAEFPQKVARRPGNTTRLKQRIDNLEEELGEKYDYVFIDAPPSLGLVTQNIMIASDEVVLPVALTFLSMDGCAEVIATMGQVRRENKINNPSLGMVVPTLYRKTKLANAIIVKLKSYFPKELSQVVISYNVQIDEAQSFGRTIWEYAPSSNGAKMLEKLSIELYRKVLVAKSRP